MFGLSVNIWYPDIDVVKNKTKQRMPVINANMHEVMRGDDKGTKNSDKRQKCRSQTRRKGQERKTAPVDLSTSLFIDPIGKWHKVKGSYKEGFMRATRKKKKTVAQLLEYRRHTVQYSLMHSSEERNGWKVKKLTNWNMVLIFKFLS